jgi:hypothetical protein
MKTYSYFLRLLPMLMALACLNLARAEDPKPKPEPAKQEKKADDAAKKPEPKKEEKAPAGKDAPAAAERPKRTFEGQEPLFYFDANRRPYIEPFHKTDTEEYFICRGVIGEWYRQLLAQEANMLAEKDGLDQVTGSTCAVRLVATQSGKKLPVVSIELYTSSNVMRSCILGDGCPQSRTAIMYVLDKTLYRSWFVTDREKKIRRFYCLDNKSNVLAKQECWYHFFDKAAKEKPPSSGGAH